MPISGGYNLNTAVGVLTLASVVFGGGIFWATTSERIDNHRKLIDEVTARAVASESHISGLGVRVSNVEWRMENAERLYSTSSTAIANLERSMQEQASDIKVMREIMERIEQNSRSGTTGSTRRTTGPRTTTGD